MPPVRIVFYKDAHGGIPVLEWLRTIRFRDRALYRRTVALIELLGLQGYELRRPSGDHLGGGLYELRTHAGRVQIRILYFFHGKQAVVLSSVLRKEERIPAIEFVRASERRRLFQSNPTEHSHEEDI